MTEYDRMLQIQIDIEEAACTFRGTALMLKEGQAAGQRFYTGLLDYIQAAQVELERADTLSDVWLAHLRDEATEPPPIE